MLNEFHDEVEVVFILEKLEDVDYVRVIELLKYS